MDAIINKIVGLSRNAKIAILVAVAIFTPAVSIVLSVVFHSIGLVLGLVNWGVLFLLVLGYGVYKARKIANSKAVRVVRATHDPIKATELGVQVAKFALDVYKAKKDDSSSNPFGDDSDLYS